MKAEEKAAAERVICALNNAFHSLRQQFRQAVISPVSKPAYYIILFFYVLFAAFSLYPVNNAFAQEPAPLPAAPALTEPYSPQMPHRPPQSAKRKFINSGILRPKIKPPKKQEPDFPAFSASVFVPKFFDSHERFERVDLSNNARLRFITAADFYPFNYIDKNGNLAGYNIDLVRALCAELRVENICRIEALPWNELTMRLQTGAADALIAGLAPTAENRGFLNFSRAYMRFPARFIALRRSAVQKDSGNFMRLGYGFSEFLLLRGASLRIGVIHNTAHEKMLENYFSAQTGPENDQNGREKSKNNVQLLPFADKEALIAGLKAKKIDLAFGDGMNFALLLNAQGGAGIAAAARNAASKAEAAAVLSVKSAAASQTEEETCCVFVGGSYPGIGYLGQGMRIAVAEKDKRLAAALDYALQQLERKGRLAELYLRYFPVGFY